MNSLTAIVPFYNEEKFLEESVSRLLENNIFDSILLIDDNSTDQSGLIAKKLSGTFLLGLTTAYNLHKT